MYFWLCSSTFLILHHLSSSLVSCPPQSFSNFCSDPPLTLLFFCDSVPWVPFQCRRSWSSVTFVLCCWLGQAAHCTVGHLHPCHSGLAYEGCWIYSSVHAETESETETFNAINDTHFHLNYGHHKNVFSMQSILLKLTLCSSRKYPHPHHGGNFT